jgi:hypothetical protein
VVSRFRPNNEDAIATSRSHHTDRLTKCLVAIPANTFHKNITCLNQLSTDSLFWMLVSFCPTPEPISIIRYVNRSFWPFWRLLRSPEHVACVAQRTPRHIIGGDKLSKSLSRKVIAIVPSVLVVARITLDVHLLRRHQVVIAKHAPSIPFALLKDNNMGNS